VAPAASADQLRAEVATAERGLDELGAARLAVDAADTLAVAQRVGDVDDIAHALAVYEQASLTYHLVAGRRPAGETDGGAGS
jgi:1,2-phenylacetyl-CoA epoxidase catalytic subunit